MRRLRVGVVGAGIGASHIEAYHALPDMYEVVTLCDIDSVRGGAVARRFAIPATTDRLERVLELDLDIVDICTPSGLHQVQAIAALEAGFHVVVEKPVARSLAELDAVAAAETAAGKRVCPIFQYRFGHGVQKLHHLIAKGSPAARRSPPPRPTGFAAPSTTPPPAGAAPSRASSAAA